jgi:predicted transposase/invertase (TIGR01784 family)
MTLAQQLEQDLEQGLEKGREQGRQEGEHRKALLIAKNLLRKSVPLSVITSATGLSEQELFYSTLVENYGPICN